MLLPHRHSAGPFSRGTRHPRGSGYSTTACADAVGASRVKLGRLPESLCPEREDPQPASPLRTQRTSGSFCVFQTGNCMSLWGNSPDQESETDIKTPGSAPVREFSVITLSLQPLPGPCSEYLGLGFGSHSHVASGSREVPQIGALEGNGGWGEERTCFCWSALYCGKAIPAGLPGLAVHCILHSGFSPSLPHWVPPRQRPGSGLGQGASKPLKPGNSNSFSLLSQP